MTYSRGKVKRLHVHKYIARSLGALLLLAIIVITLELTNVTHFFHKKPATYVITHTTGGASTNEQKGETQKNNSGVPDSNNSQQPGDAKSNASSPVAPSNLITPSGDFVSAHHANLNTSLASVCNTTPGASCKVTFTNGGIVKSLPSMTTDRGGSAYWNSWTPQSLGLTPGTWQIQATATLNGQAKSTNDAMDLEVTQ